jgi:hypothetical protein
MTEKMTNNLGGTELDPIELVPRLQILEEEADGIKVIYGGEVHNISYSDSTQHVGGGPIEMTMTARMVMQNQLRSEILQDEDIPDLDFRIPMIVHEIEEQAASALGSLSVHGGEFEESALQSPAHRVALMAEYIYVTTHFSPEKQAAYFKFAHEYRMRKIRELYLEGVLENLNPPSLTNDDIREFTYGMLNILDPRPNDTEHHPSPPKVHTSLIDENGVLDLDTHIDLLKICDANKLWQYCDEDELWDFVGIKSQNDPAFLVRYIEEFPAGIDDRDDFIMCRAWEEGIIDKIIKLRPQWFTGVILGDAFDSFSDNAVILKALVLNVPDTKWPTSMRSALNGQGALWFWLASGLDAEQFVK